MRVRIKEAVGRHKVGNVVELPDGQAAYLISKGRAEQTNDDIKDSSPPEESQGIDQPMPVVGTQEQKKELLDLVDSIAEKLNITGATSRTLVDFLKEVNEKVSPVKERTDGELRQKLYEAVGSMQVVDTLFKAGFDSAVAIDNAADEDLDALPNIGPTTIEKIRNVVTEVLKTRESAPQE